MSEIPDEEQQAADGAIIGESNIARDVTVARQLERDARHFAAIVASSDDAIISKSLDGTVLTWNAAAERLFGYTAAEIVGCSIRLIVPRDRQAEEDHVLAAVGRGETIDHFETVRQRKDGALVPISLTVSPIRDASGEIVGASKIARDLSRTERIQSDARRLAAIVDSSDDAIVGKNLNGIVTSWNAAAERMFGYSADEMIGRSVRLVIPEDRQHEEDEVLRRMRLGQRLDHYETIRRRKDGSLFPVSLTISPVCNEQGAVIGASKIARDVTERARADQERRRLLEIARTTNRLKDEFLATLSHELRTPLNAIAQGPSPPDAVVKTPCWTGLSSRVPFRTSMARLEQYDRANRAVQPASRALSSAPSNVDPANTGMSCPVGDIGDAVLSVCWLAGAS